MMSDIIADKEWRASLLAGYVVQIGLYRFK